MASLRHNGSLSSLARPLAVLVSGLAVAALAEPATAAEPASCLSPDPAAWPAPSKPYFMLAIDTSGSMAEKVPNSNSPVTDSCGFGNNRLGHARCAVKNTLLAFGGQVNFGLATFAIIQSGCGASCFGACDYKCFPTDLNCQGCGPRPGGAATRAGAFIRVPMLQDSFWMNPPPASNLPQLLTWVDNNCTANVELFASGSTPLNGMLRDMKRYFQTGWTAPDNSVTYPTPLNASDLTGTGVNGSTGCRSINVILQTDGDETCDAQSDAVNAAADLYANGVTVGGKTYKVRTHVINFAGGSQVNTNAIANAGGTGTSYFATDEVQLAKALANIISGAIKPETCDNADNNCNGCTDEGFAHYCNVQPVATNCCTWSTAAQRTTCLNTYKTTITAANPGGDVTKLPCTTAAQQADPATWLCYNPKEQCDNSDNNCQSGVDEGVLKCGNPAHCPTTETCNGEDDDCNGVVDEGCQPCSPSPEICDGCDNDCDGIADDGIAPIPCGLPAPANCTGQLTCKPPVNVQPGTCAAGGGFNTCNNSPQPETCDGVDNDCDGIKDDGVAPTECVPAGTPPNVVYGGMSQCVKGTQACGKNTCTGFVGPSAEVCDGIDNDCDGQTDEGIVGVGQQCGINQPPCTPGVTACVNGALICQGGTGPQAEVCDGKDNDCDAVADEAPLADAPAAGQNGCWNEPASNCNPSCTFKNLTWCPPSGATCNDNGTLTAPCTKGTLACAGASGWVCQSPKTPLAETCDGLDNDCNGTTDDGNLPQVGEACGDNKGECKPGLIECNAGVLDCAKDMPPTPELCDGKDNDCDGAIDNGIVTGGTCVPAFDPSVFPSTPLDPELLAPPCQPGALQCNGAGGVECVGGVGPTAEICDGIDNDCDGQVDETGTGSDGIDGTENPLPPPAASIGDACGDDTGECQQGTYACVNGAFACIGGQGAGPEECDCKDNDCDGVKDNQTQNGPAICGAGKTCVKSGDSCQCAQKCSGGEFDCLGGQTCVQVTTSEGDPLPESYCVTDTQQLCDSCPTQTITDSNGKVLCAPEGTPAGPDCEKPPVCACAGQNGCQEPCFGVTCSDGLVCANLGPKAGTCVPNDCYNVPCAGCGKLCNDSGQCVDNPCTEDTCPSDKVCKPTEDFSTAECVNSCAGVMCASDEKCVEGACIKTCSSCPDDQVCDESQTPPACVPSKCGPETCPAGACCDGLTGQCGSCPCEGVVCPADQSCQNGECFGGGSTSSSSSASGAGGGASSGTGASTGASTGAGGDDNSVFGLPTGGGGCTCEVGAGAAPSSGVDLRWGVLALALGALRRRRRRHIEPVAAGEREVAR